VPLLMGAVIAFTAGIGLLAGSEARNGAGEALVVLGAVLCGAWIALLSSHGHTGHIEHKGENDESSP